MNRELSHLKDCTILALSNLLSANIDVGLKYALTVGYHEDPKTRTAFMQVLTNILQQGTEFEGLTENFVNERYYKLIDLLYEPDMSVTVAICETCPSSDMDDLAQLLLILFESRNQTNKLLKCLIAREVRRSGRLSALTFVPSYPPKKESPGTLFRRNSIATKLLTAYAKLHGTQYLRATLEPILRKMMVAQSQFEVDPTKTRSREEANQNRMNLEAFCERLISEISLSLVNVPR